MITLSAVQLIIYADTIHNSISFIRVFHKLYENANTGILVFTAWKQKNLVTKCYPQRE